MKNKLIILFCGLILFSPLVQSQEAAPKQDLVKAQKKGKVSVSFDDELVKGATALPDGDVIQSRMENRFKRFIKIRKDFIQDVENTKDEFGNR